MSFLSKPDSAEESSDAASSRFARIEATAAVIRSARGSPQAVALLRNAASVAERGTQQTFPRGTPDCSSSPAAAIAQRARRWCASIRKSWASAEKKGALERSPAAQESVPCLGCRAGVERDLRLAEEMKVVLELKALVRPLGRGAVELLACPDRLVGHQR